MTHAIDMAPGAAAARATPPLTRGQQIAAAALFFLLVASIRLFLIHLYAVDSPYSDQWDAEGWNLLRPFRNGTFTWSQLFIAHNEHRVAMVRLVSLGLFALNDGQWDNLVSATFGTLFLSVACALAVRRMLVEFEPQLWPIPVTVLVACCVPCGYENLLVGFQMEFFFLIALTVLGVWIAASRAPTPARTLLLGLIAYACLLSLASGFMSSLAIGGALALRVLATRERWRASVPALALLASASVAGVLLLAPVPQHANLQAHTFGEWLGAMRLVASWPLPASWLSAAILWSPLLVSGLVQARERTADATTIAALALGAWVGAQCAGIAYGRAHDMLQMHSRYTDLLAVGVIANATLCLRLLEAGIAPQRPLVRVGIVCLWLTLLAGGYAVQGAIGIKGMQDFSASREIQQENVRNYELVRNPAIIHAAMPWNLPYPDKHRLIAMLDDPAIREMLPARTRPPLTLGAYGGGFAVNGVPPNFPRLSGPGAYGSFAAATGARNTAELSVPGLQTRYPYLLFMVAGAYGAPGESIDLLPRTGGDSERVGSWAPSLSSWNEIPVAVPSSPFELHARDESESEWLAFTAPAEMGRLSAWTHRLLNLSPTLTALALLAGGFALLFAWLRRFADSAPRPDGADVNTSRPQPLPMPGGAHADVI